MAVEEHEVSCPCGHNYLSKHSVNWCPKCGKRIFNSAKEQRRHTISTYYFYGVILAVICGLSYFFVELILIPIFTMSAQ